MSALIDWLLQAVKLFDDIQFLKYFYMGDKCHQIDSCTEITES